MQRLRRALLLALGLAALLPAGARALTLADLETQIRRNVRDTATSGNRYSDAILDDWINEAQREVVNLTWCVETSTSYALTVGTTYYALPSNFIAAKLVTFTDTSGLTTRLDEFSFRKVYQDEANFEAASSGTPDHYFTRYPGNSNDALEIAYVPVPVTSSTGTVKVWYAYFPSDMASDSDVPFDGFNHLKPYHYVIVAQVTAKIKAIQGKFDESQFYLKEYERYVQTMSARFGAAPNYTPSVQAAPR
jgi:hypothetical protein